MTVSTHRFAELPFDQLIEHALSELTKLDYSARTLRRYRTVWKHFAAFSQQDCQVDRYADQIADRFVESNQVPPGERLTAQTSWRRHAAFGLQQLRAFACEDRIERPFIYTANLQILRSMRKTLSDYEQFCRDRRHLRPSSLKERMRTIAIFLDYLGRNEIHVLRQLQSAQITSFLISRKAKSRKSASGTVSDLRCFLRYLMQRGILRRDLTQALPTVLVPRDGTIPSVWDPELLVKLLAIVDRTSPRGKRDYVILLLACRLGMRSGDIRTLRLDDLKWDTATIEIAQSKTGAPLCLPMSQEIGEALIDYLRSGRPDTPHREVFIRARSPFTPIAQDSRLGHIVEHWRELAGIRFRGRQRGGLHSLRHTLATRLLQKDTPLHVISDILGHATAASTMIYAKADVESLRAAALNTEEVRHGQ